MGKVKRLELWWQLYVTWLPVRDFGNFRPPDFCWTEGTSAVPDSLHSAHKDIFTFNSIKICRWCEFWSELSVVELQTVLGASVCLASSVHVLCSCAQNIISSALHVVESYEVRTSQLCEGNRRVFYDSAHRKTTFLFRYCVLFMYLSWVGRSESEIPYFSNYSGVYFYVLLCYLVWWEEATGGCWKFGNELQNLWCWSDKMKKQRKGYLARTGEMKW